MSDVINCWCTLPRPLTPAELEFARKMDEAREINEFMYDILSAVPFALECAALAGLLALCLSR